MEASSSLVVLKHELNEAKLPSAEIIGCIVSGDGYITVADAVRLLGLVSKFVAVNWESPGLVSEVMDTLPS